MSKIESLMQRIHRWAELFHVHVKHAFKALRARIRVALGQCPMCNSDAPEVDSCSTCDIYMAMNRWPPSSHVKQRWLEDYLQVNDAWLSTQKAVIASRFDHPLSTG